MSVSAFRKVMREARVRQLSLSAESVRRLEKVWSDAISSLVTKAKERNGRDHFLTLASSVFKWTEDLLGATIQGITSGLYLVAQAAADMFTVIEKLSRVQPDNRLQPHTRREFTVGAVKVSAGFGVVAENAVENVIKRVYPDGLTLSDRLWKLSEDVKKKLGDTIVQGITEQLSAKELADRIQKTLAEDGTLTPFHRAMRIARTEINNCHREATVAAATGYDGRIKDYLSGIRWNLSLSHKDPDICDVWAAHNEGVYGIDDLPVDHPHGLCYVTPILKDFEEVTGPTKDPDLGNVPDEMIDYYAREGDEPAKALQARRNQ